MNDLKLKIYHDGARYITGESTSIEPAIDPVEEYDLSALSKDDIEKLKKDKKDKNILKKARKI